MLGLYHGGENSTMVRICITDVAFLHSLRDQILKGEFEIRVTQSVSSIERGPGETVSGKPLIEVDKSHFAAKYERSIINLNKLTPHQQKVLAKCAGKSVHLKAPAGAGKTLVAMFDMLSALLDGRRVLFVSRNAALAF